jgi:methylenetetrahydrofolate dehydrogenase (NADP+)/methenyltetrahydrofolate cyclohydrolase
VIFGALIGFRLDMKILDGAATARAMREELRLRLSELAAAGVRPGLAVLLVGDDPASAVYVRSKTRACEELGMHSETRRLPATTTTEEVCAQVASFNARTDLHGILVQLPLPPQVDTARVLRLVSPEKDVDGFHPENVGLLVQKRPRFVACTPAGIMELLRRHEIPLAGRRAVVVGRSDIVGKPMALLLMHADATVTVCHSRTRELAAVCREADVLVAAIGRAGLVRREHVKPGAVVVDVGMNRVSDPAQARELGGPERMPEFQRKGYLLVGDVHAPAVAAVAGALTPVPGGVGPLTIAMLLRNTVSAAGAA